MRLLTLSGSGKLLPDDLRSEGMRYSILVRRGAAGPLLHLIAGSTWPIDKFFAQRCALGERVSKSKCSIVSRLLPKEKAVPILGVGAGITCGMAGIGLGCMLTVAAGAKDNEQMHLTASIQAVSMRHSVPKQGAGGECIALQVRDGMTANQLADAISKRWFVEGTGNFYDGMCWIDAQRGEQMIAERVAAGCLRWPLVSRRKKCITAWVCIQLRGLLQVLRDRHPLFCIDLGKYCCARITTLANAPANRDLGGKRQEHIDSLKSLLDGALESDRKLIERRIWNLQHPKSEGDRDLSPWSRHTASMRNDEQPNASLAGNVSSVSCVTRFLRNDEYLSAGTVILLGLGAGFGIVNWWRYPFDAVVEDTGKACGLSPNDIGLFYDERILDASDWRAYCERDRSARYLIEARKVSHTEAAPGGPRASFPSGIPLREGRIMRSVFRQFTRCLQFKRRFRGISWR